MIINIKVITNASKVGVVEKDNILIVKVHSSPEKGKANKEVVDLLAKHFDCPKSSIEIVRGERSNMKVVEISM